MSDITPDSINEQAAPIVSCITVGMFEENCYLYACPVTREAVIIDPGDEAERILERIQELQLIPKYILNTHGHIDHVCAIDDVSAVYPIPLAIHDADTFMYTDERAARNFGRRAPLGHTAKRWRCNFLWDTSVGGTLYARPHTGGRVLHQSSLLCLQWRYALSAQYRTN